MAKSILDTIIAVAVFVLAAATVIILLYIYCIDTFVPADPSKTYSGEIYRQWYGRIQRSINAVHGSTDMRLMFP